VVRISGCFARLAARLGQHLDALQHPANKHRFRAPLSLPVLVTEEMAAAPKFDVKMLIVPAILFFSKKIDFKDPNIVQLLRMSFGTGSHMCRRTTEPDV
jgi:hypothetical protein